MWKKIKGFIFIQPQPTLAITESELMWINEALAHFCGKCKTGFKSKAGRAAHMAIRHKNG